jgi:hypothetical protein
MSGFSVPRGVELTATEFDDLLQVEIVAGDGTFAGSARAWADLDVLKELADAVAGFPTGTGDERSFTVGSFGPKFAGGAVQLAFACDVAGRAALVVEMEDDSHRAGGARSCRLRMNVEAAAIDRFVSELRAAHAMLQRDKRSRGIAVLAA